MGGKGKQTVGFHYLFTFVAGFGRGPIDELVEIQVADKTAWSGSASDATPHAINSPNLFGGEEKEGGIQGAFRLLQGGATQVLPPAVTVFTGSSKPVGSVTIPNVKSALGGLVSEFRGFVSFVYDGLVTSMNPYLKDWKFRVRRHRAGWHNDDPWYPEKAVVYLENGAIHAMNPAHIIYQCFTDPDWGKGEDADALDENSFVYAANLLCSEGFGLCLPWYRQEDVDAFIQVVVDHIGCLIYEDRTTGKQVIRLLRNDYDPATIPLFTPDTGLLAIEEDDSASAEAVNEIVATGFSPVTRGDIQVRANNIAGWHSQGGPISRPMEWKGIPTRSLLLRRAQQELRTLSGGLKRFRLRLDRRAWQLAPGSVIRISSPRHNIENMVVRLGEVGEQRGAITARVAEDVFALPSTTFTGSADSDWTPPAQQPVPAPDDALLELGYRDLYRAVGPGDLSTATETDASVGMVATSSGGSYLYNLATKADGEPNYSIRLNQPYTGFGALSADIGPLDTAIVLQQPYELDAESVDQMFRIGDEEVWLTSYDPATGDATIVRGCSDTIPSAHAAGSSVWAIDDDLVTDGRTYVTGETVLAKCLPRTSSAVLDESEATERSLTLIGRQVLPYPPGNVKVDGTSIFSLIGEYAEPVITWAHRDRVMQEDAHVGHGEPSIGPEPGATYNLRLYDLDDNLIRNTTGLTTDTWTYDAAMQAADSAPSVVRVELETERDGHVSWQHYSFLVILKGGWGYGWGFNWGGA
ncbi:MULTISPECIES: phage tail protein [unclassified Sphingopyxis]|uniref:phage tail protein n=1 Tax=unclassified Sphingopyxis TaxID=2614943 RepID=UPI00285F8DA7|nr:MULTISPECIES: phage tail protein [unclassified Sphingopyxis]MDR7062008.1 hypothetical protein [Sphingopyxis sp. BE235]MDR7182466.1 hypothetical protein [Sphingopyxis sp. BE249]